MKKYEHAIPSIYCYFSGRRSHIKYCVPYRKGWLAFYTLFQNLDFFPLLISRLFFILEGLIFYDSLYLMLVFYFLLDLILYLIAKPVWFSELETSTQTSTVSGCARRPFLSCLGYICASMFQCKFYKVSTYWQIYWTVVFLSLKGFLSRATSFTVFLDATVLQIYKDSLVLCFPMHKIFKSFFLNKEVWRK